MIIDDGIRVGQRPITENCLASARPYHRVCFFWLFNGHTHNACGEWCDNRGDFFRRLLGAIMHLSPKKHSQNPFSLSCSADFVLPLFVCRIHVIIIICEMWLFSPNFLYRCFITSYMCWFKAEATCVAFDETLADKFEWNVRSQLLFP